MDKKPAEELVPVTVRLRPVLYKRAKMAATLFEDSVQTIVSRALEEYLKKLEASPDHGLLLIRYGRKMAAKKEGEG